MNDQSAAAGRSRRFISLKWKTLGLLSLVLAFIHLTLVLEGNRQALRDNEARQALVLDHDTAVLQKILQQSDARLQRIASIIPGVINSYTMHADFGERWAAVQVELGLESMQLYGPDGQVRISGLPAWHDQLPAELATHVNQALLQERPSGFLLCAPACLQFALVPSLGPSGERQLMVLSASLADTVLEFPGLAGADLALLVTSARSGEHPDWTQVRTAAVSDAPRNAAKLRELIQQTPLDSLEQGRTLAYGGRSYRCYTRPLSDFGSLTPGYFLILRDITDSLSDIRGELRRQLLTGLVALFAALTLLLSVLNRPMNQLRKLAQILPMLARHQYQPARDLIGSAHARRRTQSEIEVLEGAAVNLSRQLEELEQTVAARSSALASSLAELQQLSELNQKIFATAPLVLLIQGDDGRVIQANEFSSALLGYSAAELQGQEFLGLLVDPRQRKEADAVLAEVLAGRQPLYEHTGPVRCIDGGLERITWLHTRLAARTGNYVLSVGLPDRSLAEMPMA